MEYQSDLLGEMVGKGGTGGGLAVADCGGSQGESRDVFKEGLVVEPPVAPGSMGVVVDNVAEWVGSFVVVFGAVCTKIL